MDELAESGKVPPAGWAGRRVSGSAQGDGSPGLTLDATNAILFDSLNFGGANRRPMTQEVPMTQL